MVLLWKKPGGSSCIVVAELITALLTVPFLTENTNPSNPGGFVSLYRT